MLSSVWVTPICIACKGMISMPLQGELWMEGDSIDLEMAFPTNDPVPGSCIRIVETLNRYIEGNREFDSSGYNGLQMVRITNAILASSH